MCPFFTQKVGYLRKTVCEQRVSRQQQHTVRSMPCKQPQIIMIRSVLTPLISHRFLTDSRYREGHLRVVNALPSRLVLGLHSPELKLTAKTISVAGCEVEMPNGRHRVCKNGKEVIHCFEQVANNSLCHEELVIWGYLINHEKCNFSERCSLLERYIPVIDNWAVCDSYCAHAKWMAKADKHELWAFLQPYFRSTREFEVRFAIVVAMTYLLTEEWLPRIFEQFEALRFEEISSEYQYAKGKPKFAQQGTAQGPQPYYVRMAVSWCLATALAKFPDLTRAFVRTTSLPEDVIKLYVRKARESFRTRSVTAI